MAITQPALGVMILAYSYPPRGGVGSQRAIRLASSLARLGWQVSVLTAAGGPTVLRRDSSEGRFPGVEVLEAPYRDRAAWFGRFLRRDRADPADAAHGRPMQEAAPSRSALWLTLRSLLLFPDEHVGWLRDATKVGLWRIRQGDISVIVSTSPPESAHLVAARLRRQAQIPWVADFRDPWSFSHLRPPGVLDFLHRTMEARTLRHADALVTVTEGWSRRFRTLYPTLRQEVIPNGFDMETAPIARPRLDSVFRLVYTGRIDPSNQDPTPLFAAVARAIRQGEIAREGFRMVFHCYGTPERHLKRLAASLGVADVIEWSGPIPFSASVEAQRSAEVLLILAWRRDRACVPAKLFDYLAADRRILHLGPNKSGVGELLESTGRGITAGSEAECHAVLVDWYREWRRTGSLDPAGGAEAVAEHDFRRRAEQYDRLLRELAGNR